MNVNHSLQFPFDLRWTSHDLADAVPLRLSELLEFDASRNGYISGSANAASLAAPRRPPVFLHNAEPPMFRIC